jgi:hypothetical protein
MIYPKQIAKVAFEAIRAYGGTVGEADRKHWEGATQAERDEITAKVEALLRGEPHGPTTIRPSDQVKQKLLSGIVGAFVQVFNPAPVVYAPAPPPAVVPEIPVEVFPNPDFNPAALPPSDPATIVGDLPSIDEALAQADANIAAADAPGEATITE